MALPWPVTICGEVAVLHGGFLLAAQLCHPKRLSELAKADWPVVGKPIVDALAEVCASHSAYPPRPEAWKENAAVLLWTKILLAPAASASQRWKDDPFFSASSMIPEVSRTVLYELFKATAAPRLFVRLLLALPGPVSRKEAESFVQYVAAETSPADVSFFLDVWWETLKHKDGEDDRLTASFRAVSRQYLSDPDETSQPPKRFKSDPLTGAGPGAFGVLAVLAEGLKLIRESVVLAKTKCHAVANLLDVLSLSVAPGGESEELPVRTYLDKISSVVTLWSSDCGNAYGEKDLGEKVKEAERSLSVQRVSNEPPPVDSAFLRALLKEWAPEIRELLGDPRQICYEAYRLLDRLAGLEKTLASYAGPDDLRKKEAAEICEVAADLLRQVGAESFNKTSDRELVASVAMVILDRRAERHAEVCAVFVAEKEWASSQEWAACLARNRDLFQKPELVLKLLRTAVGGGGPTQRVGHQSQVAKVVLECYAQLSLAGQNEVVAGVLASWGPRGLSATWEVFSEGFQEDLNVTFNQIIQSSSGEGFRKAVASVSRLVLLNPEATVKKVSHLAVANLGTHQFLAEILCSFPALSVQEPQDVPETDVSLALRCLKESVWDRLSSAKEKEQFLEFLAYLMQPSGASPLLRPAEVTQHLVLPFLKSDSALVEFCLRVLDQVLKVPAEPAWIQSCHPFPLLFSLCKLLDGFARYWHEPHAGRQCSLEAKELVATTLAQLSEALLVQKDSVPPELWTQSVAWLHKKVRALDWTVGLRLKNVYGDHFKNEVPGTLFEVCKLPEEEWASCSGPSYGPGSGLLAWMECCCVSTALREQMLVLLTVNVDDPDEVNLFSKGFLVALVQVFPWCCQSEWRGLVRVVQSLLEREVLFVPYSLEYVHYLPLLNFRPFAGHLQFSVLMLRAFQLLCGASGASWLPAEAWRHVAKLYCLSLSDLLGAVKGVARGQWRPAEGKTASQELSFVYIQVFCHALHVAAMLPEEGLPGEPLLLLSLEVLAQYQALYDADESLGSALRKANERHFLASLAENVGHKELRALLLQKLRKL